MIEIIPQQLLVPKKVYIGDSAQLRCTFTTTDVVSLNEVTLDEATTTVVNGTPQTELPLDAFTFSPNDQDLVVKQINLIKTGQNTYQVTIDFVPWKTGDLHFPPLKIDDIELILQPIQIVSITAQNNTSTLQEPLAPLLLPGTTYRLYGMLFVMIIFIFVLIQLIVKRKSLSFFFKNKKLQRKYRRNKKSTYKKLRSLKNIDDSATDIQQIIRNYLEVRFDFPFTKCSTSELMPNFISITQNLLSDSKNEAFGEIVSVFIRTDYIRYSKEGHFNEGEFEQIIKKLITNIDILENADSKMAETTSTEDTATVNEDSPIGVTNLEGAEND